MRRRVATATDAHDGTVLVRTSDLATPFRVLVTGSELAISPAPSVCEQEAALREMDGA